MIGLALITFVAILGQGLRSSFTDAVNKQFIGDYGVLSSGNAVTDKAARAVDAAPPVEAVSEIRLGSARVFGKTVDVNGVDRNLTKVIGMTWKRGSDAVQRTATRRSAASRCQRRTYDASFAGLLGKTQEAERNRARPTPLTRAHNRSPDDSLGAGIGLDAGAR